MSVSRQYEKGNSIYIWRIVFTILIMVMHFNNMYSKVYENPRVTSGWHIAVEFFFIVSGFLLIKGVDSKNNVAQTSMQYVITRYKKLYPEYLFALLVSWVIVSYVTHRGLKLSLLVLLDNWEELFLLQCIGLNRFPFLSNVTWYISVMIIAGFILHFLITKYRKVYVNFLLPISTVIIYSYLARKNGGLDYWIYTDNLWLNDAVFRGLMDMNIGVAVYLVHRQTEKIKWTNVSRYIFLLIETVCYGFVIIMAIRHGGEYDFVLLTVMSLAVLLSFMNGFCSKISNNKVIRYINELTYAMYLNHNLWNGFILPKFWSTNEWHLSWVILYIVFVFLYSAITHWFVAKIVHIMSCVIRKVFIKQEEAV